MHTSFSPLFFCREKELLLALEQHGTPLPLSLSTLRKDRLDGRAGGIPYRRNGGTVLYSPHEVLQFISSLPKVQGRTPPAGNLRKKGRPYKAEAVLAARAGLAVADYREQQGGAR